MEYEHSDSSGTDDDLPPPQNRFQKGGRGSVNGRSGVVPASFSRMHNDMENQIHRIEQEAYSSVLRAFKAQSDAISWEKESLITELRKELRVSDEEHRELLSKVNSDELLSRIREWRKSGVHLHHHHNHNGGEEDVLPGSTMSGSHAKHHRQAQHSGAAAAAAASAFGITPPSLRPNLQSSSSFKRGGSRGKKPKPYGNSGIMARGHITNRGSSNELTESNFHRLVGRRVWTRWPDDNNFYEAVITDYREGRHALVYDINTAKETWEWVNLKEISPDDIRWEGEDLGAPAHRGGRGGPGRGSRKHGRGGPAAGQGRGRGGGLIAAATAKQNGTTSKSRGDIEILHTDTLIKEVEKVMGSSQVDPLEIEKAKRVLKEHEQSLVDAIARLEDASDGESDKGGGQALGKRRYDELGDDGGDGEREDHVPSSEPRGMLLADP